MRPPVRGQVGYNGMPFEVGGRMPQLPESGSYLAHLDNVKDDDQDRLEPELGATCPVQEPISYRTLMSPVSLTAWVHHFVRCVLGARTKFSYFIMRTISASRDGRLSSVATALFPIPLPFITAFEDGLGRLSQKKRRARALQKLMHLTIMAMNFEHFRDPMSILALIRRRPSQRHKEVYDRVMALFRASGPPSTVSIGGMGRKSFKLDARLKELGDAIQQLGLNASSFYHRGASGQIVPEDNDICEELRPYRPLTASRIRLSGRGDWDCREFLSDLLYMPFVEPDVNRFDVRPPAGSFPDVRECDVEQVRDLCRVWDANGLLRLIPMSHGPKEDQLFLHTKVFGNLKNRDVDRQIGDRRGRNYVEGRILEGPSHNIPNATALLQIEAKRFEEVIVGAVADRRDFYHQFSVSYERAASNTLYPPFPLRDFSGTMAYDRFCEDFQDHGKRSAHSREDMGDFLGMPKPLLVSKSDDSMVYAAFGALFQGDHLGVEFACCAHEAMLEEGGCHPSDNRLCANSSILHNSPVSGLVIDDYFVLSAEGLAGASGDKYLKPNRASMALQRAKDTYKKQKVLGSDDKEISDSLHFKVIGAEINSIEGLARKGLVSLGAPSEKRFGLMMMSAVAAGFPYTTDSLHSSLVGSWISVLLYRRPLMAHMNKLFQVIDHDDLSSEQSRLRPLCRAAAEELLVLSCLCPVAITNIAAPFSDRVYASDASTVKGGLVFAEVGEDISRVLWRTSTKKVKSQKLQSRTAALHRIKDEGFEELPDDEDELPREVDFGRPVGLHFDFIEVCGGAGVVTSELTKLGAVCGPVIDISYSQKYDITDRRVFEWLAYMCEHGRLRSFLAAPPCTTFSPAAHPCPRTYKQPLGIDPLHPRVVHGNDMAFSCMGLLMIAKRTRTPGMMETTRRSKLRWTPQWQGLLSLGAEEVHLASCAYGSLHQKEFALLVVSMNASGLAKKCSRDHPHLRIEGKYTKPSATYCPGLARAMAIVFWRHIQQVLGGVALAGAKRGLEDALSNEVLLTSDWKVLSSWRWHGSPHINVLEAAAALRAYEAEALRGGDLRFVGFIDSQVALRALVRGRSSSDALRCLLKRASTISTAYGLYQAGRYAPTRMNPADHPTRDTEIPERTSPGFGALSSRELRWLSSLSGLRRWTANWIRVSLLLCPSWISFFSSHHCFRQYGPAYDLDPLSFMDFNPSLGFPGEGPHLRQLIGMLSLLTFCRLGGCVGASHGDALRRKRREGLELPEGRRVTQLTSSVRSQLAAALNGWLRQEGLSFESVFLENPPDLDKVNNVLSKYGRFLFAEGKPYYHLAETINLVSAKRPILRRSLQQAWDLCAMWTSFEPVEHHRAMPVQLLLAVLASCLVWGWKREAALFALCWGMLLRPGELMAARRRDVIFPQDVRFSIDHILLRILEPKTRFRAARHQNSKLEAPDLMRVAWIGLGDLRPEEPLWPGSSSTLRHRLDKILLKLGLPIKEMNGQKPMTLASFRPGGATYMISLTESAEMVQRRGRWLSLKVMNIYLQEVAASTFMTDLPPAAREAILVAMESFNEVLETSFRYAEAKIPEKAWYVLFQHGTEGVATTGSSGVKWAFKTSK